MPQAPQTHPDAEIGVRPRRDVWSRMRADIGLEADAALAARLRVAETTVYRVMGGTVDPSMKFVAHALRAFPFATFERLFEWYAK
jgi:predicted transcriptional regulator